MIIHFRRGDYKNVEGYMGLLNRDYYLQALEKVRHNFNDSPVWVFSDEPSLAEEFFTSFGINFRNIEPPPESEPGESLILMTYGVAHVISNSTFAWWGATLSPTSEMTIAPTPWLRGTEDPRDLFPNHWVQLKHGWRGG